MKVEHLTVGGNSVIRDTADILPTTVAYFKASPRIPRIGRYSYTIPVGLTISLTNTEHAFVFDISEHNTWIGQHTPLTISVCSRGPAGVEEALNLVENIVAKNPVWKTLAVRKPELSRFIYTVVLLPTTPSTMALCGEIELYIYNEILKG